MPTEMFDWDKYFANAKWDDIRENSPIFYGQRLPSLIHQEVGLVYLSSVDLDFSLSDVDGLESIILDVKSVLRRSLESSNYYKAAVASADLVIVENLLSNLCVQNAELN